MMAEAVHERFMYNVSCGFNLNVPVSCGFNFKFQF